jgi:hypothetical protein
VSKIDIRDEGRESAVDATDASTMVSNEVDIKRRVFNETVCPFMLQMDFNRGFGASLPLDEVGDGGCKNISLFKLSIPVSMLPFDASSSKGSRPSIRSSLLTADR